MAPQPAATLSDDDPRKPKDWVSVMSNKSPSAYRDPCKHAAAASMKCLEDNQYDKGKCTQAFED